MGRKQGRRGCSLLRLIERFFREHGLKLVLISEQPNHRDAHKLRTYVENLLLNSENVYCQYLAGDGENEAIMGWLSDVLQPSDSTLHLRLSRSLSHSVAVRQSVSFNKSELMCLYLTSDIERFRFSFRMIGILAPDTPDCEIRWVASNWAPQDASIRPIAEELFTLYLTGLAVSLTGSHARGDNYASFILSDLLLMPPTVAEAFHRFSGAVVHYCCADMLNFPHVGRSCRCKEQLQKHLTPAIPRTRAIDVEPPLLRAVSQPTAEPTPFDLVCSLYENPAVYFESIATAHRRQRPLPNDIPCADYASDEEFERAKKYHEKESWCFAIINKTLYDRITEDAWNSVINYQPMREHRQYEKPDKKVLSDAAILTLLRQFRDSEGFQTNKRTRCVATSLQNHAA